MRSGNPPDHLRQLADLLLSDFLHFRPLQLRVQINEADHHPVRMPREQPAHPGKRLLMPPERPLPGQQDRIIPPDHASGPDPLRKFQKILQDSLLRPKPALQLLPIGCDGILKAVWISHFFNFGKPSHHRPRVLGPEHNAVHHIRVKRYAADLRSVHRISHQHGSGAQTFHKPLRIPAGNVRSS